MCSAFNLIVIRTSQHRAIGDQGHGIDGMIISEMQFHYPKDADVESTADDLHRRALDEMSGTTISVGSTAA